jgi:hypothetical protein
MICPLQPLSHFDKYHFHLTLLGGGIFGGGVLECVPLYDLETETQLFQELQITNMARS